MMKYINRETGIEIDTTCAISGDLWEPVETPVRELEPGKPDPAPEKPKKTTKKGGKKK